MNHLLCHYIYIYISYDIIVYHIFILVGGLEHVPIYWETTSQLTHRFKVETRNQFICGGFRNWGYPKMLGKGNPKMADDWG